MSKDDNSSSSSYSSQSLVAGSPFEPPLPPGVCFGYGLNSPMSQASNSPQPEMNPPTPDPSGLAPSTPKIVTSQKGVEHAKKRLRAFSIQKKVPQKPALNKPGGSATTILIGKLCNTKPPSKVFSEADELKKMPKPPKPGSFRHGTESYQDLKTRTLAEIEDMKRKMEMVELGIPLGLICPPTNSDKAMPTKAMPPIKTFLEPEKVDELIREAKKARAEGKKFKFDYRKILPDYDNPFQRKRFGIKEELETEPDAYPAGKETKGSSRKHDQERTRDKEKKKSDRHESRSHYEFKRDDRQKQKKDDRSSDKSKEREKSRSKDEKKTEEKEPVKVQLYDEEKKPEKSDKEVKETAVNLNDYLVCDSWSLENEDKSASPKVDELTIKKVAAAKEVIEKQFKDPMDQFRESLIRKSQADIQKPKSKLGAIKVKTEQDQKVEKLQPVIDSFTYEIDADDEVALDMFDEQIDMKHFTKKTKIKDEEVDSQDSQDNKDASFGMTEEFLESVINEIKQENMSDDELSQEKGLVEYEMSPEKVETNIEYGTPEETKREPRSPSVTPELKRASSQRSDYSESGFKSTETYKSSESGYKSTESVVKSTSSVDSYRLSDVDKDLDEALMSRMSRATVESLETWSFVLKICQPLLFRHDRNKCYRETKCEPKLWFTANPKLCSCVKDRSVVYEELEMCKMGIVDRVYGCDQLSESLPAGARGWYPPLCAALGAGAGADAALASEWEIEEGARGPLDQEYQRFMDAVWPEIVKPADPGTPTRQQKKKKREPGDESSGKKMKMSEGWSMDEEEQEKSHSRKKSKLDKVKSRKRKRSASTLTDSEGDDDDDDKNKKKLSKKKANKKNKTKLAKRRKMEKLYLKKLKEKQKKKSKKTKQEKIEKESEEEEEEKPKKSKKKKQQKLKKKAPKKKKAKSSSSSECSSSENETDSDSSKENKKKKSKKKEEAKKKKKKTKKRKRKYSSSEAASDDDLFDANILKNIKTEKNDEEIAKKKMAEMQDFSPRRQQAKPSQQIINMKELQEEFVTNNIHIKQESIDSSTKDITKENEVVVEKESEPFDLDLSKDSPAVEETSQASADKDDTPEFKVPVAAAPAPSVSTQDSQESEPAPYEADDTHLRQDDQNEHYSFHDVMSASGGAWRGEPPAGGYHNYDMYEQMAMEYQSGVASQQSNEPTVEESTTTNKIETVVSRGCRGEIKCDWRAGDKTRQEKADEAAPRLSRWGLKPENANIVLTNATTAPDERVYQIRSVLEQDGRYDGRDTMDDAIDYDAAYRDMYGAADRLQYGDCFERREPPAPRNTLDSRIDRALRETVLGEVAKEDLKDEQDTGILLNKSPPAPARPARATKRVSFADGYKPGQDSDTEEPPVKKPRRRPIRGCAWPCGPAHAAHVPLWDALPPPPPPPGSPPPRALPPPLVIPPHQRRGEFELPHHMLHKFDRTASMPGMMPPEPPPGMLNLQHIPM